MNSALNKIFDTILQALNLFRFWVVLDEYESGIILKFGKFDREVGPGLHWKLPLNIEKLLWLNIRRQTSDSWEMTIALNSGDTLTVSFDMVIKVIDAKKALLNVDDWKGVTYTTAKITLAQLLEKMSHVVIMGANFTPIVVTAINQIVFEFGTEVTEFGLTDKAKVRAFRLFNGPNS